MIDSTAITNKSFVAKGKRGIIEKGFYHGTLIACKKKHPESKAVGTLETEYHLLSKLANTPLAPYVPRVRGYSAEPEPTLYYDFLEGQTLKEWVLTNPQQKHFNQVIEQVTECMLILDDLGISKEEMHHPWKHIIVRDQIQKSATKDVKIALIDFERAHYSLKPKNLSQWVDFLCS
ncbi:MAG: hypothetical protein QW594_03165, partial [Candidatus Woesearchaeota archaeon]